MKNKEELKKEIENLLEESKLNFLSRDVRNIEENIIDFLYSIDNIENISTNHDDTLQCISIHFNTEKAWGVYSINWQEYESRSWCSSDGGNSYERLPEIVQLTYSAFIEVEKKTYAFNNDNISTQDRVLAIKQIQKITNLKHPEKLYCEIVSNKKIPEIYSGPMVQKQSSNVLRCPNCKSTNVKRITTGSRIAAIALVGIASGKIGKQYECKNCKYKW